MSSKTAAVVADAAAKGRAVRRRSAASAFADRDFAKLWAGETVSAFGSQVTDLALPLTAILALQATPAELGVLAAAKFLPFLLAALPAGLMIDRTRRRPLLVAANVGSAIAIGSVPLAGLLGVLSVGHLYGAAFAAGAFNVVLHVGFGSYVPRIVGPDRLTDANSKLLASASAANVGGPGIGGLLVQLLSGPGALVLDALSFLASALGLVAIRKPEQVPEVEASRSHVVGQVRDGLRFVFGDPYIRPICAEAATYNASSTAAMTVFLLYATDALQMSPGAIGAVFSAGGVGAFLGSLVAARILERLGLGRAISISMLLGTLPLGVLPWSAGAGSAAPLLLIGAFGISGFAIAVSNVLVTSLRQAATPDALLGRMTASYRFVSWGVIPVGALVGGAVGDRFGVQTALAVGVIGVVLAPLWILSSRVRRLRSYEDARSWVRQVGSEERGGSVGAKA